MLKWVGLFHSRTFAVHELTHLIERKQALRAAEEKAQAAKRPPPTEQPETAQRATKTARGAGLKGASGAAGGLVPDEYLPPNKIIFLRQLPETIKVEELTVLYGRFAGFREVRTVPGRTGIAFVEYDTEEGAISAKEATQHMKLGEPPQAIRVTYQRG